MTDLPVTLADIKAARARIAGLVQHTPLIADPVLTARMAVPVNLKLEYLQDTGAFKLRGATNAILSLSPQARMRGVVTASTGNHGRALAFAARAQGVHAVVCLSRLVPANKVEAVRAMGAEVRIIGESQDDAMVEVARAVREEGLTDVPPFDAPSVVAGQGTLGLEILEDCPDVQTVLVPLSGGGLAAGVAAAIKAQRPNVRVIGLSMARGAAMAESLLAGHPVVVTEVASLADSLGGGIGLDNRVTFAMCRALLDDVILVSEDEIAEGMRHIFAVTGARVEGASAVGVGALLSGKINPHGPVVALLTGANVDPELHAKVMTGIQANESVA
jgi:threonine dehydratase